MNRGYENLIGLLRRPTTTLALPTLQASIVHYLVHPLAVNPTPLPLVAAVCNSPLFLAYDHPKLECLSNAFRYAAHAKNKTLEDEGTSLFAASLKSRFGQWVQQVVKGMQGDPVLRVACATGLLQGINDLEWAKEGLVIPSKSKVEDEAVIAVAEVLDLFRSVGNEGSGSWENEFRPSSGPRIDTLSLVLSVAAPQFALIPTRKLRALPLQNLIQVLLSVVTTVFKNDKASFLSTARSSTTLSDLGQLGIMADSTLRKDVARVTASPAFGSVAHISKLLARAISVSANHKPAEAWSTIQYVLESLTHLNTQVEGDWQSSGLARIRDESALAEGSREITIQIWTILKTLLFTNIMLTQSILSVLVYLPPSSAHHAPAKAALSALDTFFPLSFVITQFGGITSAPGAGFAELKRAVYTALDVLAADATESERFVRALRHSLDSVAPAASGKAVSHKPDEEERAVVSPKVAFGLACIEQLIPALSEQCLREDVIPLCVPYLNEPLQREAFESAHSVMLSIFASHAQRIGHATHNEDDLSGLAERLVPFYVKCLIGNAGGGRLSTEQLRLAYAALVRSASAVPTPRRESAAANADALALFCVTSLLDAIREAGVGGEAERLQALQLALIATISSLGLALLPKALDAVRDIVVSTRDTDTRKLLLDALHAELLNKVGDAQKEFAMRWWYDHRDELVGESLDGLHDVEQVDS